VLVCPFFIFLDKSKVVILRKYISYCLIFFAFHNLHAQNRAEAPRVFELIHTDLILSFEIPEQQMNGSAYIKLSPYAMPQNKLTLDAQSMLIHNVSVLNKKLEFSNDGKKLNIVLDRLYQVQDTLAIRIDYTARPKKIQAISTTQNRGLFFVNPKGNNPNKPTQIWTNGIPNANSVWFPTIDHPNQKMTQTISMEVPDHFTTLSNGLLITQKSLENGNRVDTWALKKPHAPYLAFIAAGQYEIIKDSKGDLPINYYVESDYLEESKIIFKQTPEMIAFFENLLNVDYPWSVYNQVVVRDFEFGAMENTTAVAHNFDAYQSLEQLNDENKWELVIAHEIFHQWFGDLVTPESWSNVSLSESFATYSEFVWLENKYNNEKSVLHLDKMRETYFNSNKINEQLNRKQYDKAIEVFDPVSYQKGALVIHMLRQELGDHLFYKSLNHYLKTHSFNKAEINELRLSFEEVTGQDLTWFFDQWFNRPYHPKIQIDVDYNTLDKTMSVSFKQLGDVYNIPLNFSIYSYGGKKDYKIRLYKREQSIVFPYSKIPDLIEVNPNLNSLVEVYQNMNTNQYMFQAQNSQSIIGRLEALEYLKDKQEDAAIFKIFASSIESDLDQVSIYALNNINLAYKYGKRSTIKYVVDLAQNMNTSNQRRAAAIELLGKLVNPEYYDIYNKGLESKSFSIMSQSLTAMYYINQDRAFEAAKSLPDQAKKGIAFPLVSRYIDEKNISEMPFVANYLIYGMYFVKDKEMKSTYEKGFEWVIQSNNPEAIKNLCQDIVDKSKQYDSYGFKDVGIDLLRRIIGEQYKLQYDNRDEIINIVSASLDELISLP